MCELSCQQDFDFDFEESYSGSRTNKSNTGSNSSNGERVQQFPARCQFLFYLLLCKPRPSLSRLHLQDYFGNLLKVLLKPKQSLLFSSFPAPDPTQAGEGPTWAGPQIKAGSGQRRVLFAWLS